MDPSSPTQLYLDLLKKSLSFLLWPEPPEPIEAYAYQRKKLSQFVLNVISKFLAWKSMKIFKVTPVTDEKREHGLIWPGYADTMIGMLRLNNIQECVETALKDGIPGDFIETGVWRGGACIFMRGILAAHQEKTRRVFVADSFAGLPPPDPAYPADKGDQHHVHEFLAISLEQVQKNFARYGLLDDRVVFLKGWFSETLPKLTDEKFAVIRLDGDMYSSTIDALNHLYDRLSPGGFCIIDDYALKGCKQAVDDFRASRQITEEMHRIDWSGHYWRKRLA